MPAHSLADSFATPADAAACRALLRSGSRSFHMASLLLPPRVRDPATSLYAFCRMADDAVDTGGDGAAALEDLRVRLDRIYAGNPAAHPADRAFADVVAQFEIPRIFPEALLEGFAWDFENRSYRDLPQLRDYAMRVAGSVGAMMAIVMGVRHAEPIARACDLGVAMQLTNIARDVGEDARLGRLYLPQDWLRAAGIDPAAWLARPVYSGALAGIVERLLEAADALYVQSARGVSELPADCRPGMQAARLLYREIGREVARRSFDSVGQRAVVSTPRKARVLAAAALCASQPAVSPVSASLPEARFLLDALPGAWTHDMARVRAARRPRVEERVLWLFDLFERLERREQRTGDIVNLS